MKFPIWISYPIVIISAFIITNCSKNEMYLPEIKPETTSSHIEVLTDYLEVDEDGCVTFQFRLEPYSPDVNFVYGGQEANIIVESVDSSDNLMGDPETDFRPTYQILDIVNSYNENGDIIEGQFITTVSVSSIEDDMEDSVSLIFFTNDENGHNIKISSDPIGISYNAPPILNGIVVAGIQAEQIDKFTFYVKLPYGIDSTSLPIEFLTESTVMIDDETSPDSINLSEPKKITISRKEKTSEYLLIAYYSNLPIVYVSTPSPVISKDYWVKMCKILIANAGENDSEFEQVSIKGRGNSSWAYPKKPYAIKLDTKSEILGMPKHKRWCLLANWIDRTNIRNEIAFEISRRMTGLEWTPNGRFVDLVFNGVFCGNYYLCEQIKIDPHRLPIDEMSENDVSSELLTGGYLLELDKYFDEVNKFKSDLLNLPVNIKSPDEDILQDVQFNYIKDYFNQIEGKLIDHVTFSEIEGLLDIDSFIDWWIVHEITVNREPNHPKSTYMYKKRNGKLFAGPVWDFDYFTFVDRKEWRIKDAVWYSYLFKYPEFVEIVKKRWEKHRGNLLTIGDYVKNISERILESAEYDCKKWPIGVTDSGDEQMSFQESIERLIYSYNRRFDWIDNNIKSL